jgi:hypothetical protein
LDQHGLKKIFAQAIEPDLLAPITRWPTLWDYRIDCERDRRYPAIYQKAA